jgi:uncharacterized membrane protein YebE (DUF533 family)
MPVRIVKDDANEEVLSDYFNFDNPQDTGTNNSDDNSWGGGGSRGGSGGGNALFSFLGSMAVQACVNYAFNALWGGGSKKQSSQSQSFATQKQRMNYQEADDMLQQRLASAELCVSMWAHTALSDGKMQQAEREAVDELITDTVSKLFPQDIADQTIASSTLQKRLKSPHSYQEVVRQAVQDYAFALKLYQQACLLVASDENLQEKENVFLANLAQDLHIQDDDVTKARSYYKLF